VDWVTTNAGLLYSRNGDETCIFMLGTLTIIMIDLEQGLTERQSCKIHPNIIRISSQPMPFKSFEETSVCHELVRVFSHGGNVRGRLEAGLR
jgi:hypothetical protein